jgi:mRNA-degrading endonuclease YafQ of YafQ-DinJ toxin-antitoxin module
VKRYGKYGKKYGKDMKNTKKPKLNSEKIGKIMKTIVK